MKFVTRNERTQLDAARDAKARLKATLAMTEARLLRAEQFASNQQFTAIIEELGIYQGLMEDALRFMAGQNPDSNKTRDLYKRLEIKLRDDATRLEAIRRQTPVEYGVHIKAVADFAQASRTEALNSFYSDTVLRDPAPRTGSKAPPNERPKSNQPENQR